jgi:hypothetical protein
MEKRWREENDRIMREHPVALPYVGASEEAHSQPSSALSEVEGPGSMQDGSASTSLSTSGEEGNTDEPTLPLPEPDHHKRELP